MGNEQRIELILHFTGYIYVDFTLAEFILRSPLLHRLYGVQFHEKVTEVQLTHTGVSNRFYTKFLRWLPGADSEIASFQQGNNFADIFLLGYAIEISRSMIFSP